jgi:hypothetical protein
MFYTDQMRYKNLTRFNDKEFKRLVGVPRPLFAQMITILQEAERSKKKSGRPHTLTIEDQLLLTFNYLRSYSTQIELAAAYDIAESNVNRTIRKCGIHITVIQTATHLPQVKKCNVRASWQELILKPVIT